MMKICTRCKEDKDLEYFTEDKRHTDGLQSRCTPCRSEDNRQRKLKYGKQGKCQLCGKQNDRTLKTCCNSCAKRTSENQLQSKLKIVEQYGGALCSCCGETEIKFLTIDHIHNDGASHRKEIKNFYCWLIANSYPEGFQVLCWNCNLGKYHNKGICPHKTNN